MNCRIWLCTIDDSTINIGQLLYFFSQSSKLPKQKDGWNRDMFSVDVRMSRCWHATVILIAYYLHIISNT